MKGARLLLPVVVLLVAGALLLPLPPGYDAGFGPGSISCGGFPWPWRSPRVVLQVGAPGSITVRGAAADVPSRSPVRSSGLAVKYGAAACSVRGNGVARVAISDGVNTGLLVHANRATTIHIVDAGGRRLRVEFDPAGPPLLLTW